MNKRIIRTGEYSPNYGSHFGSGCIFLGIGEYEEKKKYYENQRKLECKQYLAQQAQKCSTVKIKNGLRTPVLVSTDTAVMSPPKIDTPRNDVATQTISRLMQDASTYTELDKSELGQNGDSIKDSFIMPIRKQNEAVMPRNISNDKTNHFNELSSIRSLSPRNKGTKVKSDLNRKVLKPVSHLVKGSILTDILNQNTNNIGELELNTDNARRRWIHNAASYAGDLRAQVEEKNKIRREFEKREKREELARDKWVMEDDERHKEELEKHKARKDTVKEDIVTDTLIHNTKNIGELELNTDNARRRWIHNAASYAGDLDAQIEEKNKIRRELEEKEKREELARDKWVMKDDERHKEELEKHKARKDTVKEDIVTDTLNQNTNNNGELESDTDNARRHWIHNAASYAGDLCAQVEEKNKIRREFEKREKREESARGKWVMKDDERHKEELEKHKARKDTVPDYNCAANTARSLWINNAASYDGDLHAQVEEKNKIRRELEEKEKREELARDKWVMKDDERHEEELEKHNARKDTVPDYNCATNTARSLWIHNAASYAGDLHAQIEEKNKIRRELEEKEKREELARDKWVMEDDERHKEELEKHHARKDTVPDYNCATNTARRRWFHNAASYAGDLHAQIEEKNKIRRELEEKEKREELARGKWVMMDDERHKEELEKSMSREDTHQKAMEEFSHCQEQNWNVEQEKIKDYKEQRKIDYKQYLTQQHQETMGDLSHHQEQIRKDNEERRISGTGQRVSESPKDTLASVIDGIGHSSKEDDSVQLNQNPKRSSNKHFKNDLMPCQGSDIFRNRNNLDAQVDEKQHLTHGKSTGGTRVSSGGSLTARECQSKNMKRSVRKPVSARLSENSPLPLTKTLPKSTFLADNLGKEEMLSHSIVEKVPGNKILCNLGFLRKQLEIDQRRMLQNNKP